MLKAHPVAAAVAGAVVAALIGLVIWLLIRRKPTPEELEQRRRLMVNREGRTIEGEISDADERWLHYVYSVMGVEYCAAQDVSTLRDYLPCEPDRVVGEVSVKYLRNNAANSIVVCEDWSGLPARQDAPSAVEHDAAVSH